MKKSLVNCIKNTVIYVSVFAVLAVSVLSVFTGFDFGVAAAGAGSRPDYVWGGAQGITAGKVTYAGGTGTAQDPYLVSNGDQLYKMVYESGRLNAGTGAAAYFKLTNDIYLNDVSADNWYESANLNDWYHDTSLFDKVFAGTFDGGNFTIYGLYFAQSGAATIFRGFVARANDATFKNINFRKAYMSGCNWAQALLVGRAERITVERVSAIDFYSAGGNHDGGLVASAPGAAYFKDCFVADYKDVTNANNDYGILAARSAQNTISLENCVSLGCQLVSFESNAVVSGSEEYKKWESYSFKNVYSDTAYTQSEKPYWGDWQYAWSDAEKTYAANAVKVDGALVDMNIDAADVKGDAAKTTLAGFDFDNVWKTTNGYPEFRNTDIWDGDTVATVNAFSGEGTESSPYLIYNANQLYSAIKLGGLKGETPAYFKVMNDIYLNDVKSGTIADIDTANRNNWLSDTSLADVEFKGILDGNYNTVYGLYASFNGNAALIPTANGAVIKNLTVSDSDISGATVGGIIGSGKATVTGCAFTDSTVNATTIGGGIAASGTITATACYSHSNTATGTFGGILGNASGTLVDCYSVGYYPVTGGSAVATTVFTDADGSASGITKKNTADMKGVNALSNMAFTDATNYQPTSSYPIVRIKVEDTNASKVWDGTSNDSWLATGNGSMTDPYEISTAAQFENLRQKFTGTQTFAGEYFVLTDDIYFNSVVYDDWYTNSPSEWWGWSNDNNKGFAGNFDGQGHTIYGLYTAAGPQTGGLFPVLLSGATVKNLSFESAYIAGNNRGNGDDAFRGAVAGVINGAVNISNVYVGASVILSAEKAGGIAGWVIQNNPATVIENCAFVGSLINDPSGAAPVSAAGFVGATWSDNTDNLTILSSYTTANIAAGQVKSGRKVYSSDKPTYQVGTTNADGTSLVSVGSIGKMMGKAAVTNMPGLAWGDVWNMSQTGFPTLNRSGYSVWVGTEIANTNYAGGDGSEANPYIIENANQLYKAINARGKNSNGDPASFKIKDGVTAIYLNAVAGMSADEAKDYLMKNGNPWLYYGHDAAGSTEGFVGKFNGNGCTIYGLYQHGTARSHDIGLIPTLGNGAYIANLNVTNSVVISDDTQHHAGIISERVIGNAGATIKNVGVTDSYVKAQWAGGVVGSNCGKPLTVENCLSVNNTVEIKENPNETNESAGGMFGDMYASVAGTVRVIDCLCIGSYPTDNIAYNGAATAYYFEDVYTDIDITLDSKYAGLTDEKKQQLSNIKLLTSAQINGDAAKTSMAFDFDNQWSVTSENPVPMVRDINNGDAGVVWSGKVAEYFMLGEGTESNPFVVDTPERLYKALNDNISGVYYLITEDIYLNDIANDVSLWSNEWDLDSVFTANISGYDSSLGAKGGNHTVYGLYKKAANGEIAALIPELGSNAAVKNIKLAAAHLEGESGSIVGGIAGLVSSKASNVSVAACEIEDSVSIIGGSTTGGVVARIDGSAVIYDCAFKSKLDNPLGINGAIVGESTGVASVFNSYALGTHIAGKIQTTSGVYSNVSQSTSQAAKDINFIRLPSAHFEGANAQTYMTALDFVDTWSISDKYPVIIGEAQPFNGTVGGIWSGLSATDYAGGTGDADDPYLIATGEQLYKCVTTPTAETVGKHYKLIADILLNNVYVEKQVYSTQWAEKTNLNSWVSQTGTHFRGHFDGDGHIVSGIYYADQEKLDTGYVALFPAVHEGAVIENVGVTDMYVDSPFTGNTYAAAIVGCVPLYDPDFKLAQQQVTATKTAGEILNEMYDKDSIDEYRAKGISAPIVRNCFADDTVSISAYTVGGIVCGSGFMIDVSNCYFTGSLAGPSEPNTGAILGNAWIHGSRTTNCFGFTPELTYFNGNMFRSVNFDNTKEYIGDCYGLSKYEQQGVTTVIYDQWQGEAAKTNLSKLDFENVWQTVEGGTPVLKVFLKHGNRKAEDISFMGPLSTTLSFSGEGVYGIDPITAPIKSPVELPVPERYGYEFVQWHVFQELGWPYDYGYMPFRNLTLFAEWKSLTITQNFESYTNTEYDMGSDWQNFRPGVKGFNTDYVHGGAKSMRRLAEVKEDQDMLINYKTPLTKGIEYNMSFWVCTPEDNANTRVSLVRNTWPDILEPITGVETILVTRNTVGGKWTKYTYKFTADTEWVSFRTDGNAEIFFDDITFVPVGGKALGGSSTSPATGESTSIPYLAVVASFAAGAVMMYISRKNMIEVIEK